MNDQSWSAFVHWLKPDQPAATKEVRPYVGGTLQHGRRSIRTVEQRFFLTLDADYAKEDFPLDTAIALCDVPYVIHTTWRHTIEEPRYRLIIPLSRGVEPNEYKELSWAVMNRLGGDQFDVTTVQAERFMWSPSSQDDDTYFWRAANAGAPYLHVDEWLDGPQSPSDGRATNGRANTPPPTRATGSGLLTASAEDKERALEILAQACEKVEHVHESSEFAGRNEAVFHLLPLLFRFCEAEALDEDTVLDALWTAAQRVPADEPYTRQEFNVSVRSAWQYAMETGPTLPETTPTKMAQADFEDVDVAVDIWDKTPVLHHVALAADSIGRNRLAMLAVVLTRILHEVPPDVCLPGVEDGALGDRAPINLGVALVGASGQGKSTINTNSRKLLRSLTPIERHPSTGQGLIQEYLYWDPEAQENRLQPDPRRYFYIDEIEKLGQLSNDTGSTLTSEIRTMLTGGSTGSSNATKERQRKLEAGSYNFQLVIGVQPPKAGALLDGRDAGTPQRFIWVSVTDPNTALRQEDRPRWPGELDWSNAFLLAFEFGEPVVRYPDWLLNELQEYDYKSSLEGLEGGNYSKFGHNNLLRLKVAAGIAFLHQSHVIDDLHVEIADMILASSKRTQLACERIMAETVYLKKKATKRSDERVRAEMSEERLKDLVKNARTHLTLAKGEWVKWTDNLRPAYRDRDEYEDAVWDALVGMDDVECEEKPYGTKMIRKARISNE